MIQDSYRKLVGFAQSDNCCKTIHELPLLKRGQVIRIDTLRL